jgi:hypothetical protein
LETSSTTTGGSVELSSIDMTRAERDTIVPCRYRSMRAAMTGYNRICTRKKNQKPPPVTDHGLFGAPWPILIASPSYSHLQQKMMKLTNVIGVNRRLVIATVAVLISLLLICVTIPSRMMTPTAMMLLMCAFRKHAPATRANPVIAPPARSQPMMAMPMLLCFRYASLNSIPAASQPGE